MGVHAYKPAYGPDTGYGRAGGVGELSKKKKKKLDKARRKAALKAELG